MVETNLHASRWFRWLSSLLWGLQYAISLLSYHLIFLNEYAIPFKLIVLIIACIVLHHDPLICVLWVLLVHLMVPAANPVPQPLVPLTFVNFTCLLPDALSLAFDSAFDKVTNIDITITKPLITLPMSPVILPVAFVHAPRPIDHHTDAMSQVFAIFCNNIMPSIYSIRIVYQLGLITRNDKLLNHFRCLSEDSSSWFGRWFEMLIWLNLWAFYVYYILRLLTFDAALTQRFRFFWDSTFCKGVILLELVIVVHHGFWGLSLYCVALFS